MAKKPGEKKESGPTISSSGIRQGAILLMSMEQDVAALVMSKLPPQAIEALSFEIARLSEVPKKERDGVIEEFYHLTLAQQYVARGGIAYAKALLGKSLPKDQADKIIASLEESIQVVPFQFLMKAESENILTFIQDEHPQSIALIMAYMPPAKAAEVLAGLPPEKQIGVVKRIANMENTNPDVIAQVESSLEKRLSALLGQELQETGGVEAVAEVLNLIDRSTERGILENLEEEDPDLVDKIRRLMFVFEDIILVNDKGIQNALKEVEHSDLALALKTASEELKQKFFHNMSARASELVKEDMEYLGPVRVADVEQAQQQIVDIIRKLEESGDAIIQGRGGGDEMLV